MPASNSGIFWVKMLRVNEHLPVAAPVDEVDEDDRAAAIARVHDLFIAGNLALEKFSELLEQVFTAPGRADLEAAMLTLPPLVRLTPTSRRLTKPLILHAGDGGLQLGHGWQLAADTTISTGFGATRVDLTAASWDSSQINLRLETWGSIEVLVPEGVAVQMTGGSGHIHLESLSTPATGGPVLRISTSGPTGVIRIRHPKEHNEGWITRWRRRRTGRISTTNNQP